MNNKSIFFVRHVVLCMMLIVVMQLCACVTSFKQTNHAIKNTVKKNQDIIDKKLYVKSLLDTKKSFLTKNGETLITLIGGSTISVWNYRTMDIINQYKVDKEIYDFIYDENNKIVYANTFGGVFSISLKDDKITTIPNSYNYTCLGMYNEEPLMLCEDFEVQNSETHLLNLKSGEIVWKKMNTRPLAFSRNGEQFVLKTHRAEMKNPRVYIYETKNNTLLSSFSMKSGPVLWPWLSPLNKYLVTVVSEQNSGLNICVYDIIKGDLHLKIPFVPFAAMSFSADETKFIVSDNITTGKSNVFDLINGAHIKTIPSLGSSFIYLNKNSFISLGRSGVQLYNNNLQLITEKKISGDMNYENFTFLNNKILVGQNIVDPKNGIVDIGTAILNSKSTFIKKYNASNISIFSENVDGAFILKAISDNNVVLEKKIQKKLLPDVQYLRIVDALPSLNKVIFTGYQSDFVYDLNTKTITELISAYSTSRFIDDNTIIITCLNVKKNSHHIGIYDLRTNEYIYENNKKYTFNFFYNWLYVDHDLECAYIFYSKTGVMGGLQYVSVFDYKSSRFISTHRLDNDTNSIYATVTKSGPSNRLFFFTHTGQVDVYEIPKFKKIGSLRGHSKLVTQLWESNSQKQLYSLSLDGVFRIWDYESFVPLSMTHLFSDGGWITMTPEGSYVCSAQGHDNINIAFHDKSTMGIDQFYDVFFRPDIVALKLQGHDIAPLVELTIDDVLASPPPSVEIFDAPDRTAAPSLSMSYRIEDQGGGIGEVRVFHNGKLIKSDGFYRVSIRNDFQFASLDVANSRSLYDKERGLSVQEKVVDRVQAAPKGQEYIDRVDIALTSGLNEISVCAFNRDNTIQSVLKTVRVTADIPPAEPRLFIVSIGIDQYADSSISLKYAAKDAGDMAAQLQAVAPSVFKQENIHMTVISNHDASKQAVQLAIENLESEVGPADTVVVFFAGHGVLLDNQYYFVTTDYAGQMNDGCLISSNEIVDISKRLAALNQLMIFDTCHAGGVDYIISGLYDARMAVMAKKLGLHLFASCNSVQQAMDGYKGNGLFTHHLLQALSGNPQVDANKDRNVSMVEVGDFTRRTTTEISASLGHPQTPTIINFGKDSPMYRLQ